MTDIHIESALDVGNGYTKAFFDINDTKHYTRVIPSVSAKQYNSEVPTMTAADFFEDDQMKSADMSFHTPLVKDSTRRVIGEEATYSPYTEQFDVYAPIAKSDVDLSGVLLLGLLTKEALKYAYDEGWKLDDLTVSAKLALALPIDEHKKHHKAYREKLEGSHHVTVYNLDQPVTIRIDIEQALVVNEGESARYALLFAKPDFVSVVDSVLKQQGIEDIEGSDVMGAENVLVMDIGEGTTDFAVFTNARFNANASNTLNKGYATVLESTLDALNDKGGTYSSRQQLSELLYTPKTALNRSRIERIERETASQTSQFSQALTDEIGKVFNRVGGFVDVIYVIGGGAGAMKPVLEPMIQSHIDEFQVNDQFPIIYLDGSYSRFLNVQGLVEVLHRLSWWMSCCRHQLIVCRYQ